MVAALLLLLFTNEIFINQKAKGNVLNGVGSHNTKSMTEKNVGNNTGEMHGVGLCVSCTEQAVLVCWLGGPDPFCAIGPARLRSAPVHSRASPT